MTRALSLMICVLVLAASLWPALFTAAKII